MRDLRKSSIVGLILIATGLVMLVTIALLSYGWTGWYEELEKLGSLASVGGVCTILVGSVILMRNYMRLYTGRVRDEILVPSGVCRSKSFDKHRCIIKINATASEVLEKVINTLGSLRYEVVGKVAKSATVMKRRQKGLLPFKYSNKAVIVVINVKEVTPNSTVLVIDFEVSGIFSSGALDLVDIAKEITCIVKNISV